MAGFDTGFLIFIPETPSNYGLFIRAYGFGIVVRTEDQATQSLLGYMVYEGTRVYEYAGYPLAFTFASQKEWSVVIVYTDKQVFITKGDIWPFIIRQNDFFRGVGVRI